MYDKDVNARPTAHDFWGSCVSVDSVVVKDSTQNPKIIAELCNNNKDDDGDGLTDCHDLECQTSPTCRNIISSNCPSGSPPCDNLLGFPHTRYGDSPDNSRTCPLSVGYIPSGSNLCLPRCRLYFPGTAINSNPHDPSIFAGSDRHCNVVTKPFATVAEFTGPMECVHLSLTKSGVGQTVQHDVCLPKNWQQVSSCADCTGSDSSCIQINYKERLNLIKVLVPQESLVQIPGFVGEVEKTARFCVQSNL